MEQITVSEECDCLFNLFSCRNLRNLQFVIVAPSALCDERDVR